MTDAKFAVLQIGLTGLFSVPSLSCNPGPPFSARVCIIFTYTARREAEFRPGVLSPNGADNEDRSIERVPTEHPLSLLSMHLYSVVSLFVSCPMTICYGTPRSFREPLQAFFVHLSPFSFVKQFGQLDSGVHIWGIENCYNIDSGVLNRVKISKIASEHHYLL